MAHNVTTTLYPSTYNCGMATSWSSNYSNFANYADSCAGYDAGERYARAMMFDSSSLSALRGKTIVSITLTIYMDRFGSDVQLAISHKANNSSTSVTRGSAINTFWASVCPAGVYADTNFTLTSGGIPTYGYVVGLAGNTTTRGWVNCSTSHLTVVTSEPDTYTVSYNKGANGTGTNTSATKTENVTLTLAGAIFTRTGYTQTGWSTTDGGAKVYNLSGSYTTNAGVTLYPYWTINTYTVSYNKGANGTGTNTSATKTYGVALTLQGAIFTRSGYAQKGWSTSDGGSKAYNLGGSYTANAAITLYPYWEQNASVILIYNANGGIGGPGVVTATTPDSSYTFNISYSVPTKTGFECLGWATTSNSSTVSYTGGDTITVSISTPIVLYAVWRPINTVRMVNRIGTKLKTYKIYIIDNNNTLIPHYAMIVNEDGVSLENYS